ncbi:MAG: phosphoenolpyruvate synthase [Candidatus Paceibacterota bacterium]|jgi:pyruvate,water dikinase
MKKQKFVYWFKELDHNDVPLVGGKNASLGEMYQTLTKKGIRIPNGFAISADAYFYFLKKAKIFKEISRIIKEEFNPKSIDSLQATGKKIRSLILNASMPKELEEEIIKYYNNLSKFYKLKNADVAVRSSATAEDLPTASFAGQQETYLNISGEKNLLISVKKCMASLFTDRAIAYREEKGFNHLKIGLSVGVQKMVRSDLGSSGVMFTLDTETGFSNVVLINSIWGVGELIVQGKITPDEFFVFKPTLKKGYKSIIVKNLGRKTKKLILKAGGGLKSEDVAKNKQLIFSLSDGDVITLAKWACLIEDHYSKVSKKWMPQDIEWAKDGQTGELFIVQSRPETVHRSLGKTVYREYELKTSKEPILKGIAVGDKIGQGKVRLVPDISKMNQFKPGEILVTKMTDPDWVPIMKIASAIITDEGGKTAHAAIVSRELGIPCIVGTKNATKVLKNGQYVTIDCSQGQHGKIYEGKIKYNVHEYNLKKIPKTKVKVTVNIGSPEIAFKTAFLPVKGVGLAREEFIIAQKIKVHPLALYHFNHLKDKALKAKIEEITVEHKDKKEYFVKELSEGIAQIAAAFYPQQVIVRFSDFKTNEYAQLIGGKIFEPEEGNPMIGWRGASRYYDSTFAPAFLMECQAIRRAREEFGLKNIAVMVPFCRTVEEGKKVINLIIKSGIKRKDLKIYVMCEIPSNVILAEEFLKIFDGMSIGSNDLTQLVVGLDRDNAQIAPIADERNEAVKKLIAQVIKVCNKKKKYSGICGEAPSTYVEFAKFLDKNGIESVSLSPDAVIKTIMNLGKK